MSKFSLPALAALTLLTACSAAARTEADAQLTQAPAAPELVGAEAITPLAIAPAADAPTAADPIHSAATYTAISCDVRSRRTANGVLIRAFAFADRHISGEYDLVITKSGGGSSADISQSGPVDLAAGASAMLGESEISIERGARLRAVLTLRDESGQLCRHTFNL